MFRKGFVTLLRYPPTRNEMEPFMLSRKNLLPIVVALALSQAAPLQASGLSEVTLEPMTHRSAELTLVLPDGERVAYSPADLEGLTTYQLETRTPWRDEEAVFEGVRLKDLLAKHGLDQVDAITVRAENDYTITMERDVWENEDFLIATRVDGRPHSRRARGPIQFVLDWDAYQSSEVAVESHLVWMAAEIAPAE